MRAIRTGSGLNWGKRCLLRRKIPDEVGQCERLQISVTPIIIICHTVNARRRAVELPYDPGMNATLCATGRRASGRGQTHRTRRNVWPRRRRPWRRPGERAQGSPAGGQGGTEAFRGMQAGSAGGLQHTPRALRIWADRGTCTAQVACARGPRGAGHSTTGYCAAAQASVVDMVGRMWRQVGCDACEMLWSGCCGVAVWSAVRWERLLEGFPGRLVVLTKFNSEL